MSVRQDGLWEPSTGILTMVATAVSGQNGATFSPALRLAEPDLGAIAVEQVPVLPRSPVHLERGDG